MSTGTNQQGPSLKPKPANQQSINTSQVAPSGTEQPFYQVKTNEKGQIIFLAVDPTSATSAALNAFQHQQKLQQQQKQYIINQFQQNNKNNIPAMPASQNQVILPAATSKPAEKSKQSLTQISKPDDSSAADCLKQQEILKQRLLQEELKYQKLQQRLRMLESNSCQNSPNTSESNFTCLFKYYTRDFILELL